MNLSWITPVRLAAIVVASLAAVIGVGVAVQHAGQHERPAAVVSPPPTPATDPLLHKEEARAAAETFIASWCALDGRPADQWAADLKALSTPDLAAAWKPNIAETLDGDCPWGGETVRYVAGSEGRVAVRVRGGKTIAVDVRKVDGRVLVSNLDEERYPGDGSPGVTDY